ncbi:ABC transporter substrate-binding protein [Rhodococcus koreensis]|uniref:Iron(III) transport system substrate-binding protein n=1 Tax=Rhodococcus koreensis TaxID=99653 RepID=A0A1H4SRJ5_9NOCA|nr:extracellular solute-binding protein [Rhodococcus koreensis]SEC46746.1 iron(III) transport system substrate-binding protein [Rhodococcus koreensis]
MRSVPIKLMAVAVVAAFASAACGSGGSGVSQPVSGTWDDVVAAAKSEGSVLLYSSQNPANLEALKVAFEQEYPEISLEYVRGTDADINPKVEVENQTKRGTADVHMLTDSAWIETAAESGTYSADLVGPAFDTPEYEPQKSIISDKFFLTSAAVFSLGWNTTALPGGLQKPEDLLDPALKGKIGIVNPSGIASYVDFYRFFEKNFGPDYLQKLAELKPRIYPSALGVAQALTSGEIVATPVVQPLVREKESGAPVDWALPTPPWGTPWFTHALSAAPHPNAAQVLANFMVTPAGQKALSLGYASALPGIEGSVARAQDIALPNPSDLTPESLTEYQADWEKRFIQ